MTLPDPTPPMNPYAVTSSIEESRLIVDSQPAFDMDLSLVLRENVESEVAAKIMKQWWMTRQQLLYLAILLSSLVFLMTMVTSIPLKLGLFTALSIIVASRLLNALSRHLFLRYFAKNYRIQRETNLRVRATHEHLLLIENDAALLLDWRGISGCALIANECFLYCTNGIGTHGLALSVSSEDEHVKLVQFAQGVNATLKQWAQKPIGIDVFQQQLGDTTNVSHPEKIEFHGARNLRDASDPEFAKMVTNVIIVGLVQMSVMAVLVIAYFGMTISFWAGLFGGALLLAFIVLRRWKTWLKMFKILLKPQSIVTKIQGYATPSGIW